MERDENTVPIEVNWIVFSVKDKTLHFDLFNLTCYPRNESESL